MSLLYADWCHVITSSLPRPLAWLYSTPGNGTSNVRCIMPSDVQRSQAHTDLLRGITRQLQRHSADAYFTLRHFRVVLSSISADAEHSALSSTTPLDTGPYFGHQQDRILRHLALAGVCSHLLEKLQSVFSSATPTRFLRAARWSPLVAAFIADHVPSMCLGVPLSQRHGTVVSRWDERPTFTVAATFVLPTQHSIRCLAHSEINLGWACISGRRLTDVEQSVSIPALTAFRWELKYSRIQRSLIDSSLYCYININIPLSLFTIRLSFTKGSQQRWAIVNIVATTITTTTTITWSPSNPRPTTRECVHLVTRGHFRSRDKDGGHTIRSAIAENPTLRENFILCFRQPELWSFIADRSFTLPE